MKVYKIVIKDGRVISHSDDLEFEEDLQLVRYCLSNNVPKWITHDILDAIQDYYNSSNDTCFWNYVSKEDLDLHTRLCDDCLANSMAVITIDGKTHYYEEA